MNADEKRRRTKIESIISKPKKELLDFMQNFVKEQKQRMRNLNIQVCSFITSPVLVKTGVAKLGTRDSPNLQMKTCTKLQ
jgi:hypothetical protein